MIRRFLPRLSGLPRDWPHSSQRMKRVRLTAAEELPASFSYPGALSTKVNGRDATLTLPDVNEPVIAELRSRWQADVTVEDMNLEDIFLELHSGTVA